MREPRPKQLFPTGGKNLYELLRLDHEPVMIDVFPEDECARGRADERDTLVYARNIDPMLYFWPVEGQHVLVHFNARPADLDRLVKALLRDGAGWVTVSYKKDKKPLNWAEHEWHVIVRHDWDVYAYEHWGDTAGFMRRRYGESGDAMGVVAVSGGGSGAGQQGDRQGSAADSGGLPDRER